MSVVKELHARCDRAVASFKGEPLEVKLPEGLDVADLHEVVAAWRDMGWRVEVDSSTVRLVIS